jgi:uncharacterized protein (DUF2132 family)
MTARCERAVYNEERDFETEAAMSVQELHGITLESLLTRLVDHYGWEQLGQRIDINCFISDPSIKSSLKFLRKTPWAREKVESLYLFMLRDQRRQQSSPPRPR